MTAREVRPRVLVLSRNYPSDEFPIMGIWAHRLTLAARAVADPTVVSPVAYVPPGAPLYAWRRLRRVPPIASRDGLPVYAPRVPVWPGYLLHSLDARMAYPWLRRAVDRLHARTPFDLIHAHFIYPDGVLAARLGARYGIPVMTTEHSHWLPWLERHGFVRRQVMAALPRIRLVTGVSSSVVAGIHTIAGAAVETEVLFNVVDEQTFTLAGPEERVRPDQIVFVGAIRHVKGFDVLVRALPRVAARRPGVTLVVIGEPFLRGWQRDEREARDLIEALGLRERVRFAGRAAPPQVAEHLRRSAVCVVPSRRESFSVVATEALACGTPVVATRCGGPEDIVTPETGRLVPVNDSGALADALVEVLEHRGSFDPVRLRAHAVAKFGRRAIESRIASLYSELLGRPLAP